MKAEEKLERKALPAKYRPLKPIAYILYFVLFCMPILGDILLIIFSIKAKNANLKNFARACLLIVIIAFIFLAVLTVLGFFNLSQIISNYKYYEQPIPEDKAEKLSLIYTIL